MLWHINWLKVTEKLRCWKFYSGSYAADILVHFTCCPYMTLNKTHAHTGSMLTNNTYQTSLTPYIKGVEILLLKYDLYVY